MVRTLLAFCSGAASLLVISPIVVGLLFFRSVAWITNGLSRLFGAQSMSWKETVEFHPEIGWKNRANLNGYVLADDLFYITTDADGWRGRSVSIADSDVVVFGDSHAFGHGIDDKDHFATMAEEVRVKAIGSDGYNGVQQLLWMRELAPQLQGKLVVWFIFPGNDLLDNLEPSMMHYRTPFVRRISGTRVWEIVTRHVCSAKWPIVSRRYKGVNYDRITKIFCPTFASERAFSACEFLIGEAAKLGVEVGARLVVFTVPDPITLTKGGLDLLYSHGAKRDSLDPGLPDVAIREACRKWDIPFVSGAEHLFAEDYKEFDDHWNRSGHCKVASILRSLARDYGPKEFGGMSKMVTCT